MVFSLSLKEIQNEYDRAAVPPGSSQKEASQKSAAQRRSYFYRTYEDSG
jgi:hypothetical protein